jgi:hypothetical protein
VLVGKLTRYQGSSRWHEQLTDHNSIALDTCSRPTQHLDVSNTMCRVAVLGSPCSSGRCCMCRCTPPGAPSAQSWTAWQTACSSKPRDKHHTGGTACSKERKQGGVQPGRRATCCWQEAPQTHHLRQQLAGTCALCIKLCPLTRSCLR